MNDILAGRVYDRQPSPAVDAVRRMLQREQERDRSYAREDIYSVPIGSRFHPERGQIWEPNSPGWKARKRGWGHVDHYRLAIAWWWCVEAFARDLRTSLKKHPLDLTVVRELVGEASTP